MRSETMLALGLCCAVIGGIIYFAVTDRSPMGVVQGLQSGFSTRRPAEAEPEKEAEAAGAAKKASVAAVVKRAGGGGAAQAPAVPEPAVAVAEAAPAPVVKRGPQPAAKDIAIGMARAELLRRYPDAAIQTSTIKDGDLIELLVYESHEGNVATFAQLLNGEVKRVYTGMPTRPGKR